MRIFIGHDSRYKDATKVCAQSIKYHCSVMINTDEEDISWETSHIFLDKWWDGSLKPDISWLGDGKTAKRIVNILIGQNNEV